MSDEDKLHSASSDGARAKSLLENELLQSAFASIKQDYADKLFSTPADQPQAREMLYLAHRVLSQVQQHLQYVFDNGKLAEAELNRLITASASKPKWEQV